MGTTKSLSKFKDTLGSRSGAGDTKKYDTNGAVKAEVKGYHTLVEESMGLIFNKTNYTPRSSVEHDEKILYALVEMLASIGLGPKQIAMALGWSDTKWSQATIDDPNIMVVFNQGTNRGVALIANRHFQAAMQGSIPAMQFILKTKGGFVEPKEAPMGPEETAEVIRRFLGGVGETTGRAPVIKEVDDAEA